MAAGQDLLSACVVSYQSFGEFARFHPHWHVLVLEGGFTRYDRFVYLPIGADEFMDQLVAHLPPRRVQLIRRYGAYAEKVRNQWKQRPGIYRFAPECRQQTHPIQSRTSKETLPVGIESTETPDVWAKLRRQSWARLLQKVYEVDPFVCPRLHGVVRSSLCCGTH